MRAVLRCDASTGSGIGHLVRCLALADAAHAEGWQVALAGTVEVPLGRRLVEQSGVPVLPVGPTARDLAEVAADWGGDVVHVDHYGLTGALRAEVARRGALSSSIEDGTFGRRPADVVIDSTLGAQDDSRPDDGSGTALLGITFAPLRGSVRAARALADLRRGGVDGAPPAVLVVLGGTDALGAASVVAHLAATAVHRTGWGPPPVVVAPPERHAALSPEALGAVVQVLPPQDDLPRLAAGFDVVLSAAGTSVWELACVGVASGIVAVTENQLTGYRRATRAGIALGLGDLAELRAGAATAHAAMDRLLTDVDLRHRLAATARDLVDGLGAQRVVAAWRDQLTVEAPRRDAAVVARRASASDADLLLTWRNDASTRTASRDTAPVLREDHVRWLARALADPDRLLLVVEQAGVPTATSRFDRRADGLWEISVTVAPEARGRGLGRAVLAAAEAAWREQGGGAAGIVAYVRPENAASARLFCGAGYRRDPSLDAGGLEAYVRPTS